MAWQAWRDGQADIYLAPVDDPDRTINISDHPANEWSPALVVDTSGNLHVAFDSYRNGNYDVFLASNPTANEVKLVAVADSTRYEVRPSLAVDASGRAWLAYEERTDNWGKDFGVHDREAGTPLYRESAVRVRCVEGSKVLDAGDPVAALPQPDQRMNSFPRLALDHSGRPWLLFQHRQENIWRDSPLPVVGAIWYEYATTLVGNDWATPRPVPRGENLLDNRPALVPTPSGSVLAFYSTDGRLHRQGDARRVNARQAADDFPAMPSWVNNDLFVAALTAPKGAEAPGPRRLGDQPRAGPSRPCRRGRGHRPDAEAPRQCGWEDVPVAPRRIPPTHRDLAGRWRRRRA